MSIETPELRGRIINSAIFLEDELDMLILVFMSPEFRKSDHQNSTFHILKKHFIDGKTFGKKAQLTREILTSLIFKNTYYPDLMAFFGINGIGSGSRYNNYEDLYRDINSKLTAVNEVRNIAAHGKISYDQLMGIDEIKENDKDREFVHNGKTIMVSKEDEDLYNNNISSLIALIKHIRIVVFTRNFDQNHTD